MAVAGCQGGRHCPPSRCLLVAEYGTPTSDPVTLHRTSNTAGVLHRGPDLRSQAGSPVSIQRMGIRYYAYPLQPSDVHAARRNPYPFISADPFVDAWGPAEDCPRMLYLDKAWRELQHVFAVTDGRLQPRISLELVKGNVTPLGRYGSHVGFVHVLTPDVVKEVAEDIVMVEPITEADIIEAVPHSSADYANAFLRRAQDFMVALAGDGLGLVYTIR